MSQFQDFKFRSVDEMLDHIPDREQRIVERLRSIVFESIPDVREKLSYNVPFYFRHKRICFIWPGSVAWGKVRQGVQFGFEHGNKLTDPDGWLERGDRKQVYTKTFNSLKEIDEDRLRMFLFEAVEVDATNSSLR